MDPPGPGFVQRLQPRPGVLVAVVAVAVAVAFVVLLVLRDSPEDTLRAFADAWERSDWTQVDELTTDPGLGDQLAAAHERLRVTRASIDPARVGAGTASYRVTLEIAGLGDWSYESSASLRRRGLGWAIEGSQAILHPELSEGQRLGLELSWPDRAPILDATEDPLTIEGTVVSVGLEPRRIRSRNETLAALEQELGLAPVDVARELDRPGVQPDWFIPLVDLREEPYAQMRPDLAPIPGVVFRRKPARILPDPGFAEHVVGTLGEITAELLERLGQPYAVGATVGRSGLELVFEQQLAGRPEVEVRLLDEDGEVVRVLHRIAPTPPEPVRTTLESDVQRAAERAVADVEHPVGVVAVDTASGEIRAVVSRPLDKPFNRALAGRYPPGSTFKTVTAAELLANGHRPDEMVSCPAEAVVSRPFRNSESRALGEISFRTAFVESCNTAFVRLAASLEPAALTRAAARFGFGATYDLPLPVAGGRFPVPEDDAELAAAAIGQGRVEASPLHMASVAAAVRSRVWLPPRLLAGTAPAEERRIDPVVADTLAGWMRGVVEEGTGAAAAVPGTVVAGKTGTAEFGTEEPRQAHAWFVGFNDNLAFAVLVEGGGSGGSVAAPLASRFVSGLR